MTPPCPQRYFPIHRASPLFGGLTHIASPHNVWSGCGSPGTAQGFGTGHQPRYITMHSESFDRLGDPFFLLPASRVGSSWPLWLTEYARWLDSEGQSLTDGVDRAGTPWLRMFDCFGKRIDELCMHPGARRMLVEGCRAGILWRSFEEHSLLPALLGISITGFFDPGLACPHTVSLATAIAISKYANAELSGRYLPELLKRDESVWQGATWMTEIKGGSDLGANVETEGHSAGDHWLLSGSKYFASNVGAQLALVAARIPDAPRAMKGLSLFLVPRLRSDGRLNYCVRRVKDKIATRSVPTGEVEFQESQGWLLGSADEGMHLILEVLNLSRVANSLACVALSQRALAEAAFFATGRTIFGTSLIHQPLLRSQLTSRVETLRWASSLTWEAASLLAEVWEERPPHSDRYHLFRLLTHLAKYWTAKLAQDNARWSMEAHGGAGVLAEHRVERWLREAMILAIWEGGASRQILDSVEAMDRKGAHRLLLRHLSGVALPETLSRWESRIEQYLSLSTAEREATAEPLIADLAAFTAESLATR